MRLVRMLSALVAKGDNILGDLVRGGWYCPTAVSYGMYVPCGRENCFFCSRPWAFIGVL